MTIFDTEEQHNLDILIDEHLNELVLFLGSICPDFKLITKAAIAALRTVAGEMNEGNYPSQDLVQKTLLTAGQEELVRAFKNRLALFKEEAPVHKRVLEHQVQVCLVLKAGEFSAPRTELLQILESTPGNSCSMLLLWAEHEDNTQALARRNRKTDEEMVLILLRTQMQILQRLMHASSLFYMSGYPNSLPNLNPDIEKLISAYLHDTLSKSQEFKLLEYLNAEPALTQLLSKLSCLSTILQVTRRPQILEKIAVNAKKPQTQASRKTRLSTPKLNYVPVSKTNNAKSITSSSGDQMRTYLLAGTMLLTCTIIVTGGVLFYLYQTRTQPQVTPAAIATPPTGTATQRPPVQQKAPSLPIEKENKQPAEGAQDEVPLAASPTKLAQKFTAPVHPQKQQPSTINSWTIPHVIPGLIQAEDYRNGGEGIGYHDTTPGNDFGAYRSDDVELADAGVGKINIRGTAKGEWLAYNVNIDKTDNYQIMLRVSGRVEKKTLHIEINDIDITGPISVPSTRNWGDFRIIQAGPVALTKGSAVVKIIFDTGRVNLDLLAFESTMTQAPNLVLNHSFEDIDNSRNWPAFWNSANYYKLSRDYSESGDYSLKVSGNDTIPGPDQKIEIKPQTYYKLGFSIFYPSGQGTVYFHTWKWSKEDMIRIAVRKPNNKWERREDIFYSGTNTSVNLRTYAADCKDALFYIDNVSLTQLNTPHNTAAPPSED